MTTQAPAVKKSRHITEATRYMLWGRSAGRCSFCNTQLTRHPETQEQVNLAEAAHIWGFSENGPRYEDDIPEEIANSIDNLMLLCGGCHKTVDTNIQRYTVEHMQAMKERHERRIALATAIKEDQKTHVVMFGLPIGNHPVPLDWTKVTPALGTEWYPADPWGIRLGMVGSVAQERDKTYWAMHQENLRVQVDTRIKPLIDTGQIKHLSVFAVAPQPLLILLGTLLGDLVSTEVYQLHREPVQTWKWPTSPAQTVSFKIERPDDFSKPPALVIGTTDRIDDKRILAVLPNASIWRVTIDQPHNDFLKAREQLQEFRELIRPLIDKIKNCHGMEETVHVFPATSVAIAVEFGRCIQAKSAPPLLIYDNLSAAKGFAPTIRIGNP